ncbi:MAG: AbrB/MazE/SpoVT family DNA-binding domain-containing protein [Chloroflexi bacterium]|nr:AbrB/MazE/SpoVT family DNA-binding domain-containing protein [Chloroflexota bacterium]
MPLSTKTRIIKIVNSQGIRIPKRLLDQAGLGKEVELEVRYGEIVVRSAKRPRHDWEERFARMAELGDDRLLDPEAVVLTSWDADEWEWDSARRRKSCE